MVSHCGYYHWYWGRDFLYHRKQKANLDFGEIYKLNVSRRNVKGFEREMNLAGEFAQHMWRDRGETLWSVCIINQQIDRSFILWFFKESLFSFLVAFGVLSGPGFPLGLWNTTLLKFWLYIRKETLQSRMMWKYWNNILVYEEKNSVWVCPRIILLIFTGSVLFGFF